MQHACPTLDGIQAFLEGRLSTTESDKLSSHIDQCPACDQLLSRLESQEEPVVRRVRQGLALDAMLQEPELAKLQRDALTQKRPAASTTKEPAHDVAPRSRLRDYRLVRKIGEGGMGTVYQALHIHLGKPVALKILPADKLRSSNAVARFQREMRAVGRLNHPNVVSASDAGNVDNLHFLVMELVEGADLARIIRDQGPLRVADACEIVRQAALGLQHAHDHALVHRDVKPSNLMLAGSGDVKVLDLGLAGLNHTTTAANDDPQIGGRLTSVGQIMGTLDYMAPEQITSCDEVDHRADIYALGATLFQLLTGVTPCGDRTEETPARIQAVLHAAPTPLQKLRPDAPVQLAQLVRRMLTKEPQDRPQSATAVAEQLEAFTQHAALPDLAKSCSTSLAMPAVDMDVSDQVSIVYSQSTKEHQPKPAPPLATSRPARSATVVLVMSFFLMIGVVAAGLGVFVFRTPTGTVRVEIPAGNRSPVSVALEKDGETIVLHPEDERWRIRIAEGTYDLRLKSGSDKFELATNQLVVRSGRETVLRVTLAPSDPKPNPVLKRSPAETAEHLFHRGEFQQAAQRAEQDSMDRPEHGWLHGRAAMMWAFLPGPDNPAARTHYEQHRAWLVKQWKKTGEGANTIPRICCLFPIENDPAAQMLAAVIAEAVKHPDDWRYPHSQMMLHYRMGQYPQALQAFFRCRKVSPENRIHTAVDHAWSARIFRALGRDKEADADAAKAVQMHGELHWAFITSNPPSWFDYIELFVTLREMGAARLQSNASKSPPGPRSLQEDLLSVVQWGPVSGEISGAALSTQGDYALLAVGWRPGAYQRWQMPKMNGDRRSSTSIPQSDMLRREGGQPVQSIASHPRKPIAAVGRWYGSVDIVDLNNDEILASFTRSTGKLRKANGVTFSVDGDYLLIGYQSGRIVVWDWSRDKIIKEKTFPRAVWEISVSPRDTEVLVGGQIGQVWNWRTGETRTLLADVNHAAIWNDRGEAILITNQRLNLVDARSAKILQTVDFESAIRCVAAAPRSNRAFTGHYNGEIRLVDLQQGRSIVLGVLHPNHRVATLHIDPTRRRIVATTGKRIDRTQPAEHRVALWSYSPQVMTRPLADLSSSHEEEKR